MKRLIVLVALGLFACGGEGGPNPPELTSLSLSRVEVRRWTEFFVTAKLTDVDGHLDDVRLTVVLDSVDGDTEVEETIDIYDIDPSATTSDVIVGLTLFGSADLGAYELTMTAEDGLGLVSDPVEARLVVDR